MLEIEDLSVHYGRIAALQGISLQVNSGEIVGLIGPNGAGKSTTLAATVGTVRPTGGRITFEGESLIGKPPERIVRRGVALVPEGRQIFGTLTVAENLQIGTTVVADRGQAREAIERAIDRFPVLREYYRSAADRLSGGEQQQLAIARALVSQPRLLLLDEPSLGLAPLVVDLVYEELAKLRDEGVTLLLVEQNMARTVELADRAYVLRTGRIVLSGTRDELPDSEALATAYLGLAR